MEKIKTLADKKNIQKLIGLFADETGCGIQHNGCPCNSCFHNMEDDINYKHICWLILLGLRGDYDATELLKDIELELKGVKKKDGRKKTH